MALDARERAVEEIVAERARPDEGQARALDAVETGAERVDRRPPRPDVAGVDIADDQSVVAPLDLEVHSLAFLAIWVC